MFSTDDEIFMRLALEQAKQAAEGGEVPVGAVIVLNGAVIASGRNSMERFFSAVAHAEILAISDAGKSIENWRLNGATLYATMEPCPMCWGAIINSRISKVIFAARDTRAESGAGEATERASAFAEIKSGLLEKESVELLKSFFRNVRGSRS